MNTAFLDSMEFFDLMQAYRMAQATDQEKVVKKFEAVKQYIRDELMSNTRAALLKTVYDMYNQGQITEQDRDEAIGRICNM